MNKLKDKVCIITGSAGSIGLASARLFLEEGAKVLLVDRYQDALDKAVASLGAKEDTLDAIVADVADSAGTRAYIDRAVKKWGGVDVLFANAGVDGAIAPIVDYPEDVFDQVMAVNVRGYFLACKYGLPVMRKGGSVIMTSSIAGVTVSAGLCAYSTSKHAVIGLARVAAKEAIAMGIRVNVVAPGPIDNAFQADIERRLSDVVGQDATKLLDSMIPMGRHGRPEEIARAALFLASDDSSFTTGAVLMADGGLHV